MLGWIELPWPGLQAAPPAPMELAALQRDEAPVLILAEATDTRNAIASEPELPKAGTDEPRERSLFEQITTYRARGGDTLQRLANRHNVSLDTLMWANNLRDPNKLYVGQELTILPVSGVLHTVAAGETVPALAERYTVGLARVAEANGLVEPFGVRPGDQLLIPDGRPRPSTARPAAPPASAAAAPATRPAGAAEWPA